MSSEVLSGPLKKFLGPGQPLGRMLLFLFKTAVFYFLLDYFFIAYTGLTIPGGRFYHPFFSEHADFIGSFRRFLLWGSAHFATLIGYPSGYTDYTMYVHGYSGVRMVYSCMGFGLMSAYAALVLAWPAPWRDRLVSLATGTVIIILLNMIRIGGLAVLFSNEHYELFHYINHHDLFNIVVMIIAFLLFTWHINRATRRGQWAVGSRQ